MRNFRVASARHVQNESRRARDAPPIHHAAVNTTRERGEKHLGGDAAIGEGNSCSSSGPERSGDARDDFVRDAGFAKGFDLFTRAAEDGRVATLQPDDGLARFRIGDQKRVDLVLSEKLAAGSLADIDDFRSGGNHRENFTADERIVKNNVRACEEARCL